MKEAFGDEVLEGVSCLKPAVDFDIGALEHECALC